MRQFWSLTRSRAGLIFGGATLTLLSLPVTASAISVMVPGTRDVHHAAGTGRAGVRFSSSSGVDSTSAEHSRLGPTRRSKPAPLGAHRRADALQVWRAAIDLHRAPPTPPAAGKRAHRTSWCEPWASRSHRARGLQQHCFPLASDPAPCGAAGVRGYGQDGATIRRNVVPDSMWLRGAGLVSHTLQSAVTVPSAGRRRATLYVIPLPSRFFSATCSRTPVSSGTVPGPSCLASSAGDAVCVGSARGVRPGALGAWLLVPVLRGVVLPPHPAPATSTTAAPTKSRFGLPRRATSIQSGTR
jgi:hypothetical protein